jgi:hypothetical protein
MGGGRWTDSDWKSYSSTHISSKETVDDIYSVRELNDLLNPKDVALRESCDSVDNPNSTAIIVGLDVTGSMGMVLESMAREGLPTLATEIYGRKPVTDPHIMFMGIGDVACDDAPLQVTQFEADIRIAEQLTKLYLERGGGGNSFESYILPWYFAAMHTKIDCFEKRNKKGFLFTVGDECPTPYLEAKHIKHFLGDAPQFSKITAEELLTMVSRQYEVFHLIVEEGSYCRSNHKEVVAKWTDLLGQRAIKLSDHTKMGEVIISTMQVLAGDNITDIINSWNGDTSIVVSKAISGLTNLSADESGLVKF